MGRARWGRNQSVHGLSGGPSSSSLGLRTNLQVPGILLRGFRQLDLHQELGG